jgi:RNA-directed DNA polymerase
MEYIEKVVEIENLTQALKRVRENKGAPGIDGMTVDELVPYLRTHWPRLKQELLTNRYRPQPVRAVEIPKPQGGVRLLGIPCVVDRFIQQAILQVLTPLFEPLFSRFSYGYRPGRNAQMAVQAGFAYTKEGNDWVVDLDVEKFFDRVNHDILMSRLYRRVKDKRLLKLIRSFLKTGIMVGGVLQPREEGTPQGSPLSPCLSNIYLDDLDKELEKRGLKFCRYADDCNVYVKSKAVGEFVMTSLKQFLWKRLKLKSNEKKSEVTRPWKKSFLGHTMTRTKSRLVVSPQSVKRAKEKLKRLFQKGRGQHLGQVIKEVNQFSRGWAAYFKLANQWSVYEELDGWTRRRFRWLLWRQWKRKRTRIKKLIALGLDKDIALHWGLKNRGPWWHSKQSHLNSVITVSWLQRQGLLSFLGEHRRLALSY